MTIQIDVIYGGAGTGKTHEIVSSAINSISNGKTIILLAPTHSSKSNLMKRFEQITSSSSVHSKLKFQTTFAYFRINWEENEVVGPRELYDVIYIDEFGLIKKELFRNMMSTLNRTTKNIQVVIAGDVVQLSPIYTSKIYISTNKLKKHYEYTPAFVTEHDYKSLFSLKFIRTANKKLLVQNHRSDSNVLNIIHSIFYDMNTDVIKYEQMSRVAHLIVNEDYIFLASKYDYLDMVYELVKQKVKTKCDNEQIEYYEVDNMLFYANVQFIVGENKYNVTNGETLTFERIDRNGVVLKNENDDEITWRKQAFTLFPSQFITAHKSQGLSLNKIIVCVDDLFDISMFYTMCTRAISDIKFYKVSRQIDLKEYLFKFHELLKFYEYV